MAVQRFFQFVGRKSVDGGKIDEGLPAVVGIENARVDPAEENPAFLRGQACHKPRVVGVHVGQHEVGPGRIDLQVGQALLHRLVANRAVEAGIDDQIAVFPLDHIGIQIFEGAVGQRHDDPVQARENFFRHFKSFLSGRRR